MKLNWGFGIAAVYIIFAGFMVWFAIKASSQKYDLVTDNYYNEAVNYQERIDAGENALNMDTKLAINYLSNNKSLEISISGVQKNINGVLSFYKPDRAIDDFKFDFAINETGKQIIPLTEMAHGYWDVNAAWSMEGKKCFTTKRIFIP